MKDFNSITPKQMAEIYRDEKKTIAQLSIEYSTTWRKMQLKIKEGIKIILTDYLAKL